MFKYLSVVRVVVRFVFITITCVTLLSLAAAAINAAPFSFIYSITEFFGVPNSSNVLHKSEVPPTGAPTRTRDWGHSMGGLGIRNQIDPASSLFGPAATLTVSPSNAQGWVAQTGACTGSNTSGALFVFGPPAQPLGSG